MDDIFMQAVNAYLASEWTEGFSKRDVTDADGASFCPVIERLGPVVGPADMQ